LKKAVVSIMKNETPYIIEWVNHYVNLGFDSIIIYDNYSDIPIEETLKQLPKAITSKIIIHKIAPQLHPQYRAYFDAIRDYNDFDWMYFADADEFLFLDNGLLLEDFLKKFDARIIGGIFLFWKCYNANGLEKYEDKPVVERFTKECPLIDPAKGKCIVKPNDVLSIDAHFAIFNESKIMVNTRKVALRHAGSFTCYNFAHIKHYYTKSYEEWIWKMKRGSCDNRALKKYKEFFQYNPDMKRLYDAKLKDFTMNTNLPYSGNQIKKEGGKKCTLNLPDTRN